MTDLALRSSAPSPSSQRSSATTEVDTRLPMLTGPRVVALAQHFVMTVAHTANFTFARLSDAMDAGTDNKRLQLGHKVSCSGNGILCASSALDFLTAVAVFLDRSKSAKDIKSAKWLPHLTNKSPTLRPYGEHFATLQDGVTSVALYGAIASASALWATRQSLNDAPVTSADNGTSTPSYDEGAPFASSTFEYAQAATEVARGVARALIPPVVSTCVNLDEAKQRRHRYNPPEGPEAADSGPVEPRRFTQLPDPHYTTTYV